MRRENTSSSSARSGLRLLSLGGSTALAKNPADRFGQCHEFATAVAAVVGYTIAANRSPSSPPAPTGAPPPNGPPAGPVLEGVYRLNYDPSKQTINGTAYPAQPGPRDTSYWAFRSTCGSAGCVATGVGLDYNNPDVARTPAVSSNLGFVDDHWRDTPQLEQVDQPYCLRADSSVGPGSDT
jgi:hypothetical protein